MKPIPFFRVLGCLITLGAIVVPTASADPGKGKGKGGGGAAHGKGHGNQGQGKGQAKKGGEGKPDKQDKGGKWDDQGRALARFKDKDKAVVTGYFDQYRGNPHGLPPGLAKKVARGKALPPGWQKKLARGYVIEPEWWNDFVPVEDAWFPGLEPYPDTRLYWYGDRVVRVYEPRREVVDVIVVSTIHIDL